MEKLPGSSLDEGSRWIEIDEQDLRLLFRKHWRLIVWFPVAAVLAALSYCLIATPLYTTSTLLYLRPNFDKDLQVEQVFSKLEDDDSLRSLEKAVVSDTTILRMIETLHLREDSNFLMMDLEGKEPLSDSKLLKRVRKRYEAKVLPTTRVLRLTVTDPSPARAGLIADALVQEFLKLMRDELKKEQDLLRKTLTVQAGRALEESMKSEAALEAFRGKYPGFLVEQDSSVFSERVLQYGRELNEAKAVSSRLKGSVEALNSIDPEKNPIQIFEIVGTRDNQAVTELLKLHTTAESELAAAKQIYGVRNPQYRVAEQSLEQVQRSLRNYAAELKDSAMSDYTASLRKAEQLEGSLQSLQGEFGGYKARSAEFRGLKAEVDKNWNTHSELQKKILALTLNPELSPMVAIPISEPVIPHKPSYPSKLLFAGTALVLSLMLTLAYILFNNRRGLPFTSAGQLRSVLGLPSIGIVEMLRGTQENQKPSLQTGVNLVGLSVALASHRTVHFLSMVPSGNLAQIPGAVADSLARNGYNTLLVSIRDREEDGLMTGDSSPRGFLELSDTRTTQVESSPSPRRFELPLAALVHREEFRRFLKRLLEDFDRVVFDSTAITEPEGIVAVAKEVKSNVIVVSEEGILRPEAVSYLERMRQEAVEGMAGIFVRLQRNKAGKPLQKSVSARAPETEIWPDFSVSVGLIKSLEERELGSTK